VKFKKPKAAMKFKLVLITLITLLFAFTLNAQTKITIDDVAEITLPSGMVKANDSAMVKIISANLKSDISNSPLFKYHYTLNNLSVSFYKVKQPNDQVVKDGIQQSKSMQGHISKEEDQDIVVNGNFVKYHIAYSQNLTTIFFYCTNSTKVKAFTGSILCTRADVSFAKEVATEIMKSVKFI
jgi:hypothetical protein